MRNNYKTLIDVNEFQQKVLDFINSDEIDKAISNTVFADKPECKSAIIYGMTFSSALTSSCEKFRIKKETENVSGYLVFARPWFLKIESIIKEFELNLVLKNNRTTIYENDNVQFSFDKKIIRVLLYDENNKKLKHRIQDYFYEKQWKRKTKGVNKWKR